MPLEDDDSERTFWSHQLNSTDDSILVPPSRQEGLYWIAGDYKVHFRVSKFSFHLVLTLSPEKYSYGHSLTYGY